MYACSARFKIKGSFLMALFNFNVHVGYVSDVALI